MNQIVNAFFQLSSDKFQYLVDELGFRRGPKRSEGGLYRVLYESETTAVEIGFEWNEQYVYVELFRLINGKIQENPIVIQPNSEVTVHNLEDLIAIRSPKMTLGTEYFGKPITVESLEHVLSHYARALRELGGDVLQGDFTVFNELGSIVKARISLGISADDRAPVTRPHTLSKKHSMRLSGRSQVR
jgi:hypothetical protein